MIKKMFSKKDRILIIVAHPDDEVLGCGGTILKARSIGALVSVLFLGEGVSTRFPGKEDSKKCLNSINERKKSAYKCLKKLDVHDYRFYKHLCTKFDTYPLVNFVRLIEDKIKLFKPNIIFTHNKSDINIDHGIVYDATEIACRPLKTSKIQSIYTFEVPCSSNFKFNKLFQPNVYINIKKYFRKKLSALMCYQKEIKKYPHPRSTQGVIIQTKYRGLQSGLEYAEAFELKRLVV